MRSRQDDGPPAAWVSAVAKNHPYTWFAARARVGGRIATKGCHSQGIMESVSLAPLPCQCTVDHKRTVRYPASPPGVAYLPVTPTRGLLDAIPRNSAEGIDARLRPQCNKSVMKPLARVVAGWPFARLADSSASTVAQVRFPGPLCGWFCRPRGPGAAVRAGRPYAPKKFIYRIRAAGWSKCR